MQAAQHELKTKSTNTQQAAKIQNRCVMVMVANKDRSSTRVAWRARIPPNLSMTGPSKSFPRATESVDSPRSWANWFCGDNADEKGLEVCVKNVMPRSGDKSNANTEGRAHFAPMTISLGVGFILVTDNRDPRYCTIWEMPPSSSWRLKRWNGEMLTILSRGIPNKSKHGSTMPTRRMPPVRGVDCPFTKYVR